MNKYFPDERRIKIMPDQIKVSTLGAIIFNSGIRCQLTKFPDNSILIGAPPAEWKRLQEMLSFANIEYENL